MSFALVKAHLNLFAVMQNLEDLVKYDPEISSLARNWNLSMAFVVRRGPRSFVDFRKGGCTVGSRKPGRSSVKLYFTSPEHLNDMFDGTGKPIPLKGFTKLGFLTKDFTMLTGKLEYYLKPTDELLKDRAYLELNTRFTLNTAAFAAREIALLDPVGKLNASHIRDGTVLMKILPEGPAVHMIFADGDIKVKKGDTTSPTACMFMKDLQVANDFLNGRIDAFTAIAGGDVLIRGQTPMLDALSLILDRIPLYLS